MWIYSKEWDCQVALLIFSFREAFMVVSIVAGLSYISRTSVEEFSFPRVLSNILVFYNRHPTRGYISSSEYLIWKIVQDREWESKRMNTLILWFTLQMPAGAVYWLFGATKSVQISSRNGRKSTTWVVTVASQSVYYGKSGTGAVIEIMDSGVKRAS